MIQTIVANRLFILMFVGPFLSLIWILDLVRRRRLREDYSLWWIMTFGVLVLLGLFQKYLLDPVADLLGIQYPPTALFAIGFGLLLFVVIHFSVVISTLSEQNRKAAQHIGLLEMKMKMLEERVAALDEAIGE